MKAHWTVAGLVALAVAVPAHAQWLNNPTPNIPRTPDGKRNLAAAAPRSADGHVDLSGAWNGRPAIFQVPDAVLTEQSKALIRERDETFYKDRPAFRCLPSGPEMVFGYRRIIQTPSITSSPTRT